MWSVRLLKGTRPWLGSFEQIVDEKEKMKVDQSKESYNSRALTKQES